MKQVLIWNKETKQYSYKTLSLEEEKMYNHMLSLKEEAKSLYSMVINDAEKADIPVDRFIDDEGYSTYCAQNKYVDEAYAIAEKLGIEFYIPRLSF